MQQYRPEIDGLRAVSVLSVMAYHVGFAPFGGGFVGVDVFFVISGFLITGILLAEIKSGHFRLADFYERRARRILPALFLVIAATLLPAWLLLTPGEYKGYSQGIVAAVTFTANFQQGMLSGYFDAAASNRPLTHIWSLGIEEQFYILFPLLLLLLRAKSARLILGTTVAILLASLAFGEWLHPLKPHWNYYALPSRMWELLIGAVLAMLTASGLLGQVPARTHGPLSGIGLLMIMGAVFGYTKNTPFPTAYALLPTLGAALVIAFAQAGTLVNRLLAVRPLVGVGLISYSAYLWHQPVFGFARMMVFEAMPEWGKLGLCGLSLMLAWLSWRFVELPFRKQTSEGISRRGLVWSMSMTGAALVTVGLAGHFGQGIRGRVDAQSLAILDRAAKTGPLRMGCINRGTAQPASGCLFLGKNKPVVAVIGDSHAAALSDGMAETLRGEGYGAYVSTMSGCPPLTGFRRAVIGYAACDAHNRALLAYVKREPKIEWVILNAQWALYVDSFRFNNGRGGIENGGDTFFHKLGKPEDRHSAERKADVVEGYLAFINTLLQSGKKVILIDQVPTAGWDVGARHLRLARLSIPKDDDFAYPIARHIERLRSTRAFETIRHRRFQRLDPARIFCADGRLCRSAQLPVPYFTDDSHLSNDGARLVAGEAVSLIEKAAP